ncbi:LOW QUALITY PROTEIN: mediator of RNA polymerase II transcription subunit 23 [Lepeophtheirus salmonis]|uniref:LOW QUALITY PROTEIN: mediator of RNA polymerase II transcription subunit 23 n=1 Tax=Lepeophtheirus salmonis TaxID=72036 RepID=UPI003AF3C915
MSLPSSVVESGPQSTNSEGLSKTVKGKEEEEGLKRAFNLYLAKEDDEKEGSAKRKKNELGQSIQDTDALRSFVAEAANSPRMEEMMESLLENKDLSPRVVSDALLSSEALHFKNEPFWIKTLSVLKALLPGVDYKGVREIMKIAIEKVLLFPPQGLEPSLVAPLSALENLLKYIFDREAALLPGYFIVNEILKSYPENPRWPHWKLIPMISSFLNSFTQTAQMVSCAYRHRLRPIVEHYGKAHVVSTWKLDSNSLKILLKGNQTYERILPYSKEMVEPQTGLLLYVLRQPYSKELAINILGLQKPRKDASSNVAPGALCPALEEVLVNLFVDAMNELSELELDSSLLEYELERRLENNRELWRNLSSELIFFILFQFINFGNFTNALYEKLSAPGEAKSGRDELIWALLQYISGCITKNMIWDFVHALRLINLLYNDKEPIPIPDLNDPNAVKSLSAAAVYIQLSHRARQTEQQPSLSYALPSCLRLHHEFLLNLANVNEGRLGTSLSVTGNEFYMVPVMCNTYSTQDCFQLPIGVLMATIGGIVAENMNPANIIEPLPMETLDCLSVHVKMSLIHSIVTHIQKQVSNKTNTALAPALIETYSRLLVYPELESLGIKGLLNQLLPLVFKQGAWNILHVLLEIFSYRLHHIQSHFRLSLLNHLQQGILLSKHTQLNLCIESTTLKLITGLGNAEVSPPKNSSLNSQGKPVSTVLYGESEELNRVVVLTLARAIHIYGLENQSAIWVKDVLTSVMTLTPHSWPSHTLSNFPTILQDFFKENPGPKENKAQLKSRVEEEYKTWSSMSNEHDIVQHFSNSNNTLFLCVFWKMLLETDHVTPIAYRVLERIGAAKALTAHLRSLCDMLVCEFSKSGGSGHVKNCIDALNNLIWKYKIVSLDRLILCMALRTHEGSEAQVCFFIIQLLLLKPHDFRNRVSEFVRTLSPEHQLLKDFHSKHSEFHQKFPEKFGPDDHSTSPEAPLPVYFSNVCLRFIPVFDIVVHRFLELPPVAKSLETLIDHFSVLYKFHARPITYLYNTLHYYEKRVRDKPSLKKKLVRSITGALKDIRPNGWCLTEEYLNYLAVGEQVTWTHNIEYYVSLIGRLAKSIQGKNAFPKMDWRFNEFPNEGVHAMYVTCVEVMGLPVEPLKVGEYFLEAIWEAHRYIPQDEIPDWINAVGIIISNLPEAYWEGLYIKLVQALTSPPLSQWNLSQTPFRVFNFQATHLVHCQHKLTYLLAISHSVWHHAGFNQIQLLPDLVRDKFLPVVKTEEQLIFVYHLMGPFLQRLHSERYMRPLFDLTVSLYRVLNRVDKECKVLKYVDPICDILYHVKYQFTGDSVKSDAERIVKDLRPALQRRLRFIAPGILQPKPPAPAPPPTPPSATSTSTTTPQTNT